MFEWLKSLWFAIFLKKYIAPDDRKPRRYPEAPSNIDLPRHIDRYWDRNSGETTQEIEEKVKIAIANLKAGGRF